MNHNDIMSSSYGQYCPLALAAELLCQRWTVLVISRLIDGCHHFNAIHRGIPRISPSLLSRRLKELELAGLVTRMTQEDTQQVRYELTEAGLELTPIIDQMAIWGQHWARDLVTEDLDPAFLLWSMHTRMNTDIMPSGRTVIEFHFSGLPKDTERFWIVNHDGRIEMCLKDPGHEIDLLVESDIRLFVECWRGFRDLREQLNNGSVIVNGEPALARSFPDWLKLSALAPYGRKQCGRERSLSEATARSQRR